MRCAIGEFKADLIVKGGKLINVYSGEILDGMEIAVLDGRICYIGRNSAHTHGDATQIIDASGLYVAPGFIDAHTHISHYCRPYEYLQAYLPHGTTALMASADELVTVFGYPGLRFFLDDVEHHPLRVYALVSMVAPQDPLLCSTKFMTQAEVASALNDPRVLGLGEIVSWLRLLNCDEELVERIEMAQQRGKLIHGHTAGARDQKLCALAAAGLSSCHEPIHGEDALERLRLGYWTMLREGSLRQDLEATLPPLVGRQVNLQRLILVTDSMAPDDAEDYGHIDHVVRRAVSLGLSPMQAIQAVTLNPATYCGLEQEIGGIGPGRFADMALIAGLETCQVEATLVGGKIVAADAVPTFSSAPIDVPPEMMHSFPIRRTVTSSQLKILSRIPSPRVRVMELMNQTITAERIYNMSTAGESLVSLVDEDLVKVAVFDRLRRDAQIAFGFLKGWGAKVGAVGATTNLDENTLMVVGTRDEDMSLCVNSLIAAGGGLAVVDHGEVLERMAFPLGGILSPDRWPTVGAGLRRIQRCLREKGSPFEKPLYPLCFLTFVTLPALRITGRGLVNVKERKIVPLFVE